MAYNTPNSTQITTKSCKVIMVGAPKAGKTALLSRYNDLDFEPLYIPTSAGDFSVKDVKVGGTPVSAQIWDLGGSGILGKSFLRNTNGVILVVDLSNKASMKVLDNVYERVRFLVGFADEAFPCALVATKLDVADGGGAAREVTSEELKAWAAKRRANAAPGDEIQVFEVSAKDGRNVVPMFEAIIGLSVTRPGKIAANHSMLPTPPAAAASGKGAGLGGSPANAATAGVSPFHLGDVTTSSGGVGGSAKPPDDPPYDGEDSDQAIAKVVLAGAVNVGKTYLLTRFVGDDKDHHQGGYEPTVGADLRIVDMPVRDRTLTLQIWDTSGNPKVISIGRSIYKDADCLVLVYDITSRESFVALDTFWDSYLAYAQPFEPDEFPALLVGNKCDLNDRRAVPLEEVMDWCAAKRPRKPITYLESSAARSMGVNDIFVFVADAIYDYALAADSLTDDEDEGDDDDDDDDDADRSTDSPSDYTGGDDRAPDNYDNMTPAAKGSRGVTPGPRGLASARSGPTPGMTPANDRFDATPNSQRSCFCWVPFLGGNAAPK